MRFDKYVFVCINERPEGHPRSSCGQKDAQEILEAFKQEIAKHKLRTKIRANKAGCMECCEIGPTVMIHPDNTWYQKVRPEDVAEIVEEHLINGKPVQRLLADFSVYGK